MHWMMLEVNIINLKYKIKNTTIIKSDFEAMNLLFGYSL